MAEHQPKHGDPAKCRKCGEEFDTVQELEQHLITHKADGQPSAVYNRL